MNDALRLQISAFVDGELPENESELLMRRLSQDHALRELVAEYLRIGRLIRREREVPGLAGLRGRIQAALGEQPVTDSVPSAPERHRFLRPLGGLAVASAVAAVALLGLRQVDAPGTATPAPSDLPATMAAGTGYTEPQPAEVLSDRPSELLMQYYLSHGATSRDLGANGILTRLVTLELREGELVESKPRAPAGEPSDAEADATAPGEGMRRDREDPDKQQ